MVQFDDVVTKTWCSEVKIERASTCGLFWASRNNLDGRTDPRLCLARSSRCTSSQPRKFGSCKVGSNPLLLLRLLLSERSPLEIGVVAAFVHVGATTVELEYSVRDAVEHVAIVRDEEQTALVGRQPVFEPFDCVDVEMVCGLTKDEEVARVHERPGECHSLRLATGKLRNRRLTSPSHSEPIEHCIDFPGLTSDSFDGIADRPRTEVGVLIEGRDPDISASSNSSAFGITRSDHHIDQRGLPGAVQPNEADSFTIGNRDRNIPKEVTPRADHRHFSCVDEDHEVQSNGRATSKATGVIHTFLCGRLR